MQVLKIEWILDNVMPEEPGYCEECDLQVAEHCIDQYDSAVVAKEYRKAWEVVLNHKRLDGQYEYVVESLRMFGQLEPSGYYRGDAGGYYHGDGHHRLAAAIDLGWTEMEYAEVGVCDFRDDSGAGHPDEWTIEVNEQRLADLLFQS